MLCSPKFRILASGENVASTHPLPGACAPPPVRRSLSGGPTGRRDRDERGRWEQYRSSDYPVSRGLPGPSGVQHIRLVVSDLAEALTLLCEFLGSNVIYRHGLYEPYPDGEKAAVKYSGVPRDIRTSIAMLRCGNGRTWSFSSRSRGRRRPGFRGSWMMAAPKSRRTS